MPNCMIKRLILLVFVLLWLTACASSPSAPSGQNKTGDVSTSPVLVVPAPSVPQIEQSSVPTENATGEKESPPPGAASQAPPSPSPSPSSVRPSASPTQTPTAALSPSPAAASEQPAHVLVKIEGPEGWLIEGATVAWTQDMTAYDAILEACTQAEVELVTTGSGSYVYISSVGGFAEKSDGVLSGWIFKFNGEMASKGCGAVKLEENDRVSVYFTRDLGIDCADKD